MPLAPMPQKNEMTMKYLNFKKWLLKQVGGTTLKPWQRDFADDVRGDTSFKNPRDLEDLLGYLRSRPGVCWEAIEAARECYEIWQSTNPRRKVDGMSPKDIEHLRRVTRQVWGWSYPKKLVIQRCTGKGGFLRCEKCKQRTPKLQVDHLVVVGDLDDDYFKRLYCPSSQLQGLCPECHSLKTHSIERRSAKKKRFCDG